LNSKELSAKILFSTGIFVIVLFLVYNVVLAFCSLEGAPENRSGNPFFPYLSDKPLTEDGYYMLTVAWNIAEGKGFTYNRGIKTTGVQPLAALVYSVPGFLVQSFGGDKYLFARFVILLAAIIQVLFALLIYKMALSISKNPDKGLCFLVSICVVLLNFKVLLNFANGLETGLYLLLLSLFFLYWIKYKEIQPGIKNLVGLGLLSGLLLLCRLDAVIILFTFYLLLLFTRRIKFSQVAVILLFAILIYLPWQLYVLNVTGSILQSSVRSQVGFLAYHDMQFKLEQYFTSIIQHLTPFLYTGNIRLWLMYPLGIPYIIITLLLYKKYRKTAIYNSSENVLKIISVPILTLTIVYFFFSSAPYFYIRYISFIMIISLPIMVLIYVELLKKSGKIIRLLVVLLPLSTFIIQTILYFHSGKSALGIAMRPTFVKENFDEKYRIGAFQTGALGYYIDDVINLDGKMNNIILKRYSYKTIERYIDSTKIDVLIDWKEIFDEMINPEYLKQNWIVYSEDIGDGRTICYVRKSFKQ
jgi:hypothetical protein